MRQIVRRRRSRSLSPNHSRGTRTCRRRSSTTCRHRSIAARGRLARAARGIWSSSSLIVQSSRNLRVYSIRRSLRHSSIRSQSLAHSSRKRMVGSHNASRRRRSRGARTSIRDRHNRGRRTPARRSLTVNDLLQAAMFKKNMLPGTKVISSFTKLIDDSQRGSTASLVVDARVAALRHAKPQIERPCSLNCESQIRRQNDIAGGCIHLHLDRSAIEREHQRLIRLRALARSQVQPAGRAHQHFATTLQRDLSSPILRCNGRWLPTRTARPLLISSAPATLASCTPIVPMGCCAIATGRKAI